MPVSNLINHFNKRALRGLAEELKEPRTFLMTTFFSEVEEFASDIVDLDIFKGKRRTGAYVRRAEKGQLVDAIGFQTKTVSPPYLKPKIIITPEDIQKRIPGQVLFDNSKSLAPSVQTFVARQMNDLDTIIARNEEFQAMQALFEGKVRAFDDKKTVLVEVDYERDASLATTASPLWDATDPTILQDLRASRRQVGKLSGFTPMMVIMGRKPTDAFLADTDLQQQLNKDFSSRGELAFEMRDTGGIFLGAADGFEFWTYDEFIIDPEDDVEKLLIPEDQVLVGSTNARATRSYGSIAAEEDGTLIIEATARFLQMYGEKDPAGTVVQLHSAPLMVTNHPNAYATITATS